MTGSSKSNKSNSKSGGKVSSSSNQVDPRGKIHFIKAVRGQPHHHQQNSKSTPPPPQNSKSTPLQQDVVDPRFQKQYFRKIFRLVPPLPPPQEEKQQSEKDNKISNSALLPPPQEKQQSEKDKKITNSAPLPPPQEKQQSLKNNKITNSAPLPPPPQITNSPPLPPPQEKQQSEKDNKNTNFAPPPPPPQQKQQSLKNNKITNSAPLPPPQEKQQSQKDNKNTNFAPLKRIKRSTPQQPPRPRPPPVMMSSPPPWMVLPPPVFCYQPPSPMLIYPPPPPPPSQKQLLHQCQIYMVNPSTGKVEAVAGSSNRFSNSTPPPPQVQNSQQAVLDSKKGKVVVVTRSSNRITRSALQPPPPLQQQLNKNSQHSVVVDPSNKISISTPPPPPSSSNQVDPGGNIQGETSTIMAQSQPLDQTKSLPSYNALMANITEARQNRINKRRISRSTPQPPPPPKSQQSVLDFEKGKVVMVNHSGNKITRSVPPPPPPPSSSPPPLKENCQPLVQSQNVASYNAVIDKIAEARQRGINKMRERKNLDKNSHLHVHGQRVNIHDLKIKQAKEARLYRIMKLKELRNKNNINNNNNENNNKNNGNVNPILYNIRPNMDVVRKLNAALARRERMKKIKENKNKNPLLAKTLPKEIENENEREKDKQTEGEQEKQPSDVNVEKKKKRKKRKKRPVDLEELEQVGDQTRAIIKKKPIDIKPDDFVMLKVSPLKGVMRFGKRRKLNPHFIGPFKVLRTVACQFAKLELPVQLQGIHDTFHVCYLKKFVGKEKGVIPLSDLKVEASNRIIEEPKAVLLAKTKNVKNKDVEFVLVKWKHTHGRVRTWEIKEDMKKRYPDFVDYDALPRKESS